MNNDDDNDKDLHSDGDSSLRPPRSEPEPASSTDEIGYDSFTDETLNDGRLLSDYEDDSIDYDVDPDSLMDEDDEEFEPELDVSAAWQSTQLKPELERDTPAAPYSEQDYDDEEASEWSDAEEEAAPPWPLGLIIVAVFALLLLAAGGYGVMKQRASMQEEIRSLQAAVGTAANPEEVVANRESQRELENRNNELLATIDELQVENRTLRDTAQGLELQLQEVQSGKANAAAVEPAAVKPVAVKPAAVEPVAVKPVAVEPVAVKPAAVEPVAAKPAPVKTAPGDQTSVTTAVTGAWFVNFGSYRVEKTANNWATKLKPASGRVIVSTGLKNGDTFYRVRVIDLASKTQAEGIAGVLEQQYQLSKLWVGKQ